MYIRDLKKYILNITHGKLVKQIGITSDPLLVTLNGEETDIEKYVEELTKFATDSEIQVFYELLQNAEDAGSSVFYVFFNKKNLLFVNNAEPFKTDGTSNKGQLRTFLAKNKSAKSNKEGDVGKYGQGAKLIYDLLCDVDSEIKKEKRLRNAIVQELKGPIIFSWNSWSEIERISLHNDYTYKNYENNSFNLFTKVIYSYYPSLPFERIITKDGTTRELFSKDDILHFTTFFKNIFSKKEHIYLKNKLSQGTALYLSLGEGQYKKLQEALDEGVEAGISTSLIFLNKEINEVVINDKVITRKDFIKKPLHPYSYSENPINVEIAYPDLFIDENSELVSNFFQYFPITKEIRGFSFTINTPEISLQQSRQEIDLKDGFNEAAIKHYGEELVKLLKNKKNRRNEFLKLYASFLVSDELKSKDTRYYDLLYLPIVNALAENIPLQKDNESYNNSPNNVIIKDSLLDIDLGELGIDKEFVDQKLSDSFSHELTVKLGIPKWNVTDILKKADKEALENWISALDDDNYLQLLEELTGSDNNLFNIPFIRFCDGNVYSLSEIKKNDGLVLLDSRLESVKKIFSKINIVYGGLELLNKKKFDGFRNILSDNEIFDRVKNKINNSELLPQQKRKILDIFINDFEDGIQEKLRNELIIFKNIKGEHRALNQLLFDTKRIVKGSILNSYQVARSEFPEEDIYGGLFMNVETELYKHLYSDWETVINEQDERANDVIDVYNDLDKILNKTEVNIRSEYDITELPMVYTNTREWVLIKNVFYNTGTLDLNDSNYKNFTALIERITNIKTINKEIHHKLYELQHVHFSNKTLKEIASSLKEKTFAVTKEEIILLNKMGDFLQYFVVQKEADDENFIVGIKNGKQYISEDKELNKYLEDNGRFFLLPISLQPIFINNSNIVCELDVLRSLIAEKGSLKEFVYSVDRIDDLNLKQTFLSNLPKVNLISTNNYSTTSAHYKLFKIAQTISRPDLVKGKIFIDGNSLSEYIYNEDVRIKAVNSKDLKFTLSELLGKYKGKTDILKKIKEQFHGVSRGIFETNNIPISQIINELQNVLVDKPEQMAFLVAVKLSVLFEKDSFSISDFTYEGDNRGLLNCFFNKSINGFQEYFVFNDFNPSYHFYSEVDKNLLLKKEIAPEWVTLWIQGDKSKINFLQRCDNNLFFKGKLINFRLEYRKKFLYSEFQEIVKEGCQSQCDNTLSWCYQQNNNEEKVIENLKSFIKEYVNVFEVVPDYSIAYNHEDKKILTKIDYNHSVVLSESYEEQSIKVLKQNNPEFNYLVFDFISDEQTKLLNNAGLQTLIITKRFLFNSIVQIHEWNQNPYNKWIENKAINHRVFISKDKIPYEYYAIIENNEYILNTINEGEVAHKADGRYNQIYISQSIIDEKSILSVLKENSDELDIRNHELIDLFDLFEKENQELLKEIEIHQKSNKEIIQLIQDEKKINDSLELIKCAGKHGIDKAGLKSLLEKGRGKGKYDFARDVSDKGLEAINKILNSINDDLLLKLADNLDLLKKLANDLDETDAKKNPVTGFIGEMVVLNWLADKYGEENVEYVADGIAELDIVLNINGVKFEIDVKTTIKPLKELSGAVAFYIKRSQYDYIKENKLDNYYITRLSLKDIGLEVFARKYKSSEIKNEVVKNEIREKIKKFILEPENLEVFNKTKMIFKIRYDDFFSEPF